MPLALLALDLGGLLINTGEVPSREVWEAFGISEEKAMLVWKKHDESFFSGKISEDEWWSHFCEIAPKKVSMENVKQIFREAFKSYKENLEFVGRITRECKPKYVTAYWSNNCSEWLGFQKEKFHIERYVDVVLSSHEIGLTKHHQEFFEIALEETSRRYGHQFSKSETIFFDDDEKYCQNCESAGIKAVHVPKPETLQDRVRGAAGINI